MGLKSNQAAGIWALIGIALGLFIGINLDAEVTNHLKHISIIFLLVVALILYLFSRKK